MTIRSGLVLLSLTLAVALAWWLLSLTARPAVADHAHHHGGAAPASAMSLEDMRHAAEAYWATHAIVAPAAHGSPAPGTNGGPDKIVNVTGLIFDADNNSATVVDTVRITTGQTVRWQWGDGFHTVTSGTGAEDPNSGLLFDAPSDPGHTTFDFTFNDAGTVPYYCAFHELFNMKGIVIVTAPVGVTPSGVGPAIGFASEPWPNPTSRGTSFRFTLGEGGRVRADVVDARGRHVTTIVDREYPSGTHLATWDGRTTSGGRAPAGVYNLRLHVPGFTGGRSLVLTR